MRELAAYLVRNRFAAALVASLSAALPLMGIVGGAAAGLLTLHQGLGAGLTVAGLGAAVASGLTWIVGGLPALGAMVVLASTLPVCALAWVLRRTVSLSLTVMVAALAGCGGVLLMLWGLDDAAGFWRAVVEAWLAGAGGEGGASEAERQALLDRLPFELMTGSVMANFMLMTLAGLFLGRSAQARLVNPGGFRREFHGLRLGHAALAVSGLLLLAALATKATLALNMTAVVLAAWLVRGLAVMHGLAASLGLATGWLVVSYAALGVAALLASPAVLVFPLLGAVDEVLNLRGRFGRRRNGRDRRGDDE